MKTYQVVLDYSSCCPEIQAKDKVEAEKLGCTLTFRPDGGEMRFPEGVLQGTRIQIMHFLRMIYFAGDNGEFIGDQMHQYEYWHEVTNSFKEV